MDEGRQARDIFIAHQEAFPAQLAKRRVNVAGSVIFLRLSAFILLCLGVQIVWDGLSELLRSLLL